MQKALPNYAELLSGTEQMVIQAAATRLVDGS